jgi:hypothetical protein
LKDGEGMTVGPEKHISTSYFKVRAAKVHLAGLCMQQHPAVVSENGASVLCSLDTLDNISHDLGRVVTSFQLRSFQLHELLHPEFEGQVPSAGEKGLNLLLKCRAKC